MVEALMASSTVLFHVPLWSVAFFPLPSLLLRLLNFTPAAVVHEDILPGGWVITLSPLIVWMPR